MYDLFYVYILLLSHPTNIVSLYSDICCKTCDFEHFKGIIFVILIIFLFQHMTKQISFPHYVMLINFSSTLLYFLKLRKIGILLWKQSLVFYDFETTVFHDFFFAKYRTDILAIKILFSTMHVSFIVYIYFHKIM